MEPCQKVYQQLLNNVNSNPNNFQYTNIINQKILKLTNEYLESIMGLIDYHNIIRLKTKNPTITNEELNKALISISGKKSKILSLPYGGKTFDGGKGAQYHDIDEHNSMPIDLQKIIVAYIQMISL
jgi:hypothetical protein